jgi:hypothetical protein
MDKLRDILTNLGLGVASNAIYDCLKSLVFKPASKTELLQTIQNCLHLNGVHMEAADVISALAHEGYLRIENSHLSSGGALVFGANGGQASFGNNSSLRSAGTALVAQGNASVDAGGHAQIRQEGGCITIHVGPSASSVSRKTK